MTKVDVLVAKFNADFSVNKVALQGLLERNDLVYLDDTQTMYSISNRKEQVCQMFGMYDRGEITKSENKELQARTKGYAVDTALTIARPMRAAMKAGQTVVNEVSNEVEELRAQIAELQADNQRAMTALLDERDAHNNTKNELRNAVGILNNLKAKTVLVGRSLTKVFVSQSV